MIGDETVPGSRAGDLGAFHHPTFDRVRPALRHGSEIRNLAGDPFDVMLVGPSRTSWERRPGDDGQVTYLTTDCGTIAPAEGGVRNASLLRFDPHEK